MNYREARPSEFVALENASKLMDLVAAGEIDSFDDIRTELAAFYKEAGLNDAANFIIAA